MCADSRRGSINGSENGLVSSTDSTVLHLQVASSLKFYIII